MEHTDPSVIESIVLEAPDRRVCKPVRKDLENNWNVVAFFYQQGVHIVLDAFHCRCTHSRCRSSRPKRTMQETTDVRSPIRISLTAVPSILKCAVREPFCLGKCDFFFFNGAWGDGEEGHLILWDFVTKVSFKTVCVPDCDSLSKPAELNSYEAIYKWKVGYYCQVSLVHAIYTPSISQIRTDAIVCCYECTCFIGSTYSHSSLEIS